MATVVSLQRTPCQHCGELMDAICQMYDPHMASRMICYLHPASGSVQGGRVPCAARSHFVGVKFEVFHETRFPAMIEQTRLEAYDPALHEKVVAKALGGQQ